MKGGNLKYDENNPIFKKIPGTPQSKTYESLLQFKERFIDTVLFLMVIALVVMLWCFLSF